MTRRLAILILVLLCFGSAPVLAQGNAPAPEPDADSPVTALDPREALPLNLDQDLSTREPGPGAIPPTSTGTNIGRYLLTVIVWLGICIGLIYGLVALMKWFYRRAPGVAGSVLIEPLTVVGIAPGLALHVVRFHDELLLLGATNTSITLLERITDPERVAFFLSAFSPGPDAPNRASFASALRRVQHRMGLPLTPPPRLDGSVIFGPESPQAREDARTWLVADEPSYETDADKLSQLRQALKDLNGPQSASDSR